MGGEVDSDVKREWVFGGTRGEFATVLLLATLVFGLSVFRFSAGHVPRVNLNFGDWLILVVGVWYSFELYRIDKWLSLAMIVTVLQICVRILIRYGGFTARSALSTLKLLDWSSDVLVVIGLVSYLAKRLRYERIGASEPHDAEAE